MRTIRLPTIHASAPRFQYVSTSGGRGPQGNKFEQVSKYDLQMSLAGGSHVWYLGVARARRAPRMSDVRGWGPYSRPPN